jgi:putative transcriptional regulator
MSIEHHPPETMLGAFAAGMLDHGQHIGMATHLVTCPQCRAFMRAMEHAGGAVLASLPPAAMSDDALQQIEARLSDPASPAARSRAPTAVETDVPGLPQFVRRYRFGSWKWVAPSLHLRPVELPHESETRVFLLKAGPGVKLLQHTHTGIEMTCILTGSFDHEGGHYGPGDFDLGDETVDHQPVVGPGQECVCLVAMQGKLHLNGLLGRLVQPFVRM